VNNFKVFDAHAFRKHTKNQPNRSVINASLWDVMTTGLSRYQESIVEAKAGELKNYFYTLMYDDTFIRSITYGTNDVQRVKARFEYTEMMLQEVFHAQAT